MSISLKKAEESVRISLKKKEILQPPTCAVGLALDASGSMTHNYRNGHVSAIVTRLLALAKTFDDNGELDMWAFDSGSYELVGATEANYENYVDHYVKKLVGGGTSYSPVMNDIVEHYFPSTKSSEGILSGIKSLFGKKKKSEDSVMPAFVVFLTDGASSDTSEARRIIEESAQHPIFWLLVHVDDDTSAIPYLKSLANANDHVGFLDFDDMNMTDEQLYDGVISQKFVDWAKANNI